MIATTLLLEVCYYAAARDGGACLARAVLLREDELPSLLLVGGQVICAPGLLPARVAASSLDLATKRQQVQLSRLIAASQDWYDRVLDHLMQAGWGPGQQVASLLSPGPGLGEFIF